MLIDLAEVQDGKIAFPSGASYQILVLPDYGRMTPRLLQKLIELVEAGATIYGAPPQASPSLVGYPHVDAEVKTLAEKLWGAKPVALKNVGKGRVFLDSQPKAAGQIYPDYESTVAILRNKGIQPDFIPDASIRYVHRTTPEQEIYFIANRKNKTVSVDCQFRAIGQPELWDPVTGKIRQLPQYNGNGQTTTIPIQFAPYQSFFVVFPRKCSNAVVSGENFAEAKAITPLDGAWEVSFDPKWGGPEKVIFPALQDWTKREERGIKYYSGIATYRKNFETPEPSGEKVFLDLGTVHDMARVRLNGKDLGVVWCAPWRVDISEALQEGRNDLEIEVANRWVNRMRGDLEEPDKNVRTIQFEEGYLAGKPQKAGRFTFSTHKMNPGPLLPSGLLGPVRIVQEGERK